MTKLLKSHYTNGYDPEEGESEVWGNEWIGNDEEDEIVAFYCFGDSEENDEVITKIKEYQAGKDYTLTRNKKSHEIIKEKYDEYQIFNLQLRKDLKKFIEDDKEDYRHLEHLEPLEPAGGSIGIKPIKPIRPIKPVGRPKENKKWQKFRKEMAEYAKEMKDYNREVQEYNQKVIKRAQKIIENIKNGDEPQIKDLTKTFQTTTYKGNSQEIKNKWNWPAFWTVTLVASLIFSLVLIIARLFKKK